MKATALLLCALAVVVAATQHDYQQADSAFLQKQQEMLQLYINMQQPSYDPQEQQQAKNFNFQKQRQSSNNPNAVKQFQDAYEQGYLPRGQVFNYYNPNHQHQAIQLFDLFYFAKDYATFYQAAAWARNNVNEGQFAYALSVAILNRPDTQGIAIPPQAEVFPYLYVNTQAVHQAQNMKQQGQKQVYVQSNNTDNFYYNYQQEQQQQQQEGQDNPLNSHSNSQYDSENQANQYRRHFSPETQISYYNEDINNNQQFAYEQLKNPAWFGGEKYQQDNQQKGNQNNGENFFYYLQQVLARYNLERYSNNLPTTSPFQFNKNIQYGYNPQLQHFNGQPVPARADDASPYNSNPNTHQQFQKIDMRFAEAVDSNQAKSADGSLVQLKEDNGMQTLGNIAQNNKYSPNNQYYGANNGQYGYLEQCRKVVGSVVDPNNQYNNAPSALENDNSAQRDPAFYQCVSRVVNYFQNFKNQQKPYNKDQLNFQGVKVQNVKTDKLITYFDNAEVDLYNAVNYQQGEQAQNYEYKAQHPQLNYKSFNYQIQVNSGVDTNAIVRVFIGPKYNAQGQRNSLEQARQYFVEIDRFIANLTNGQNQIQRNSQDSTRFVQQQPSTRQLFNQIQQAKSGKPFYYNQYVNQQQATFPQNLMLPKGRPSGQEYVIAVALHSFQGNSQAQDQQPQDNRPQGFPFDRVVREANFQEAQNIYFQTVNVFNVNERQVNSPEQ